LLDVRFAFKEYIYGNSSTVAGWKGYLNDWLANNFINLPIFLFLNVTVGPHAELDIGPSGLICNRLSVHNTGKVKILGSGPTTIEVNTYEQYGLLHIPINVPINPVVLVNL
jgi:hypothetical protein